MVNQPRLTLPAAPRPVKPSVSRDAPGIGDPTRPTPFSQAFHTLLNRNLVANREWLLGGSRAQNPNYLPWPSQTRATGSVQNA